MHHVVKNDADAADAAQEAITKIRARLRLRQEPTGYAVGHGDRWLGGTLARKHVRRREVDDAGHEQSGEHPEEEFVQRNLTAAAIAALGSSRKLIARRSSRRSGTRRLLSRAPRCASGARRALDRLREDLPGGSMDSTDPRICSGVFGGPTSWGGCGARSSA